MRPRRSRLLRAVRVRYRLLLRRLEGETPEWMRWLTPWGTSLTVHALLLLVLALLVRQFGHKSPVPDVTTIDSNFAQQLRDDLTSLAPSDHAGDPLTKERRDSPSLSLDPNPPEDGVINLPALPARVTLGPTLNLIPREAGATHLKPSAKGAPAPPSLTTVISNSNSGRFGTSLATIPLTAPFAGRQAEMRAKLIRSEGGTVASEKAVERGLDWIVRHQLPNGSWSLDPAAMCRGVPCPPIPCGESDTGATGLALLPFLGAGHTHMDKGRYQEPVGRGIRWLLKVQRPDGEFYIGGTNHTRGYSHPIATMVLCEAYGLTKDKRLREPAQRAVNFIGRVQNRSDGGWRYEPGDPADTSVFGWDIFALRSAHLAGLNIPKGTVSRATKYLDSAAADPVGASYCYMPGWAMSYSMSAEGLVSRQLLGWPREHPGLLSGTAMIAENLEDSTQRSIYYWYYATQLLHNMKGKEWPRWNQRVRDGLIRMQMDGDVCARGSWDPYEPQLDSWGLKGGRLYMTSLSLLTLEVYYRYLPLYRDPGGDLNETGEGDPPAVARPEREPAEKKKAGKEAGGL